MAYGKIHETFWDDPILRELARVNEDTRTFMAYLITCRHKNRLGCYVLDFRYAAADLGWSEERVLNAATLLEQTGRIQYDQEQRVVLVLRFLKHNTMENKNVVGGAISALNGVPNTPLLPELLRRVDKYKVAHYQPLISALRNRLGNDSPNHMANPRFKDQPQPQPQPQPVPQPEKENSGVAAASTQDPAHNGSSNGIDAVARNEMRAALEDALARVPEQRRVGFAASARPIISGDSSATWKDPNGDAIDWQQRPQLLRVALAKCEAEGQYGSNALHSALRYEIPKQLDPFKPPKQRERVGIDSDKPNSGVPRRETRIESILCPRCGISGGRRVTYLDTGESVDNECGNCPVKKARL